MSDNFYRAFEDRYRGSRETITARLRAYLPFIEPLAALHQPARALDAGCGRGEWLELIEAHGFEARGVDLDDGMLAACRARGLQVETADAIATLRALAPGSLALVSAFHLVEHIGFDLVRELIKEALRVLQPGGLLIMETPNPENLVVGASSFYRDPSHERPIPPELLAFGAEHAGFARQLVVRLQEAPELRTAPEVHLQNVLDGVSPDYAVVAQKAAAPELMARFDTAFGADYGLSLEVLAGRYDRQQVERRLQLSGTLEHLAGLAAAAEQQQAALRSGLAGLGEHVAEGVMRLNGLEAHNRHLAALVAGQPAALEALRQALHQQLHEAQVATARALDAAHQSIVHNAQQGALAQQALEARIGAAEAQAAAMSQKVVELLSSTSWKVTAPLRYAGGIALRLRNARRNGTLGAALRRRFMGGIKGGVLAAGRAVLRNPRAKRAAREVLAHFPSLQARLREMMYSAPVAPAGAGAPPPQGQQQSDLSPRAQRLYGALRHAKARSQPAPAPEQSSTQ